MEKVKGFFIAIFGAVSSLLGILAIPMYILVLLNIIDYATGLTAAPYRKEKINSYKGFRGIAKKICMWLLVAIGAIIDWLISFSLNYIGISLDIQIDLKFELIVACMVAAWEIINEIISIIENIKDIGVIYFVPLLFLLFKTKI